MEDQSDHNSSLQPSKIGLQRLKVFFINHLNFIYSAKSHLQERLPELLDQAYFIDLRKGIAETIDDIERQITRMDAIFKLLNARQMINLSGGMISMIEDAFTAIDKYGDDIILRDLSTLFYLQNIESLEMTSFQVLQLAAVKLEDKQISQLLKESYDEAKDDRILFLMITAKYLSA